MRWLDLIHRDPVPWLLDPANPSARALTLRDIFHKPEDVLREEFDRILAWEPVERLRQQWSRGTYWGRVENPYYGGPVGNFGTLYLLAQLGVPLFPEVEPACENLLDYGRRDDGRFAAGYTDAAPWLCYTGMALQSMGHFGYGNDIRVRSAWAAMIQGILLRPELLACPIAGGLCLHGLVKALAALVSVPRDQRSADDARAVDRLCERLLNHPFDFEGRDADWVEPTFPRYYRADVLELCRTLAQTPYRTHHRYRELLRRMLALQTEQGRWIKAQATPALSEERIYRPSRWLTFEAVHVLTLTYGDEAYAA